MSTTQRDVSQARQRLRPNVPCGTVKTAALEPLRDVANRVAGIVDAKLRALDEYNLGRCLLSAVLALGEFRKAGYRCCFQAGSDPTYRAIDALRNVRTTAATRFPNLIKGPPE